MINNEKLKLFEDKTIMDLLNYYNKSKFVFNDSLDDLIHQYRWDLFREKMMKELDDMDENYEIFSDIG